MMLMTESRRVRQPTTPKPIKRTFYQATEDLDDDSQLDSACVQALANVEARANCLGTRDKHSRQNSHERRNRQHYRQFQVLIVCLLLFIEIDLFV